MMFWVKTLKSRFQSVCLTHVFEFDSREFDSRDLRGETPGLTGNTVFWGFVIAAVGTALLKAIIAADRLSAAVGHFKLGTLLGSSEKAASQQELVIVLIPSLRKHDEI